MSILLNQSQTAAHISLRGGAAAEFRRHRAGIHGGGELTAEPYPDILVTNSQSNDVMLLPGVGQGFFNDTEPRRASPSAPIPARPSSATSTARPTWSPSTRDRTT